MSTPIVHATGPGASSGEVGHVDTQPHDGQPMDTPESVSSSAWEVVSAPADGPGPQPGSPGQACPGQDATEVSRTDGRDQGRGTPVGQVGAETKVQTEAPSAPWAPSVLHDVPEVLFLASLTSPAPQAGEGTGQATQPGGQHQAQGQAPQQAPGQATAEQPIETDGAAVPSPGSGPVTVDTCVQTVPQAFQRPVRGSSRARLAVSSALPSGRQTGSAQSGALPDIVLRLDALHLLLAVLLLASCAVNAGVAWKAVTRPMTAVQPLAVHVGYVLDGDQRQHPAVAVPAHAWGGTSSNGRAQSWVNSPGSPDGPPATALRSGNGQHTPQTEEKGTQGQPSHVSQGPPATTGPHTPAASRRGPQAGPPPADHTPEYRKLRPVDAALAGLLAAVMVTASVWSLLEYSDRAHMARQARAGRYDSSVPVHPTGPRFRYQGFLPHIQAGKALRLLVITLLGTALALQLVLSLARMLLALFAYKHPYVAGTMKGCLAVSGLGFRAMAAVGRVLAGAGPRHGPVPIPHVYGVRGWASWLLHRLFPGHGHRLAWHPWFRLR